MVEKPYIHLDIRRVISPQVTGLNELITVRHRQTKLSEQDDYLIRRPDKRTVWFLCASARKLS